MQISSKLLCALTVLAAHVLVFAPLTFSAESSNATVPFADSFGSTASNEVTNWDEDTSTGDNQTKIVTTGPNVKSDSPTPGHARITKDGWIRRTIDATSFASLQLKYYWNGDTQAEESDKGVVEYCPDAGCDLANWTNITEHELNTNVWSSQQVVDLPSALNNSIFRIRFKNNSNSTAEHFRIEDVEVSGTALPISTITYPAQGQRYIADVWGGEIRGTAEDNPSSGVASVWVSIRRDEDGHYWDDGSGDFDCWSESEEEECEEILNEADFDGETWAYGFDFIEPEGEDQGYTAHSHAQDNDGNLENTNIVHFLFGRAPLISAETEATVSTSAVTITWTTDHPATSRVIYDTVPHPILGGPPNYGYSSSTSEFDTDPKVTSHSVAISGLTAGTTYFYRTVSRGSPEAVSAQKSFSTSAAPGTSAPSPGGSDGGGGGGGAPSCGDAKPGSAPALTGASADTNSVTLTWSQAEGPVTYYLITYGISPGTQQFGNPNVGGAGTTGYTVSGLSGGVTYYFKVRAGNGCAPGDFSNELSATPGGGFVAGPATGFAPGVLGIEEEATPAAAQTSEALGEKGEETPSAISGRVRTLIIIFLILGGLGIAYWYWQRRSRRLFKEQG